MAGVWTNTSRLAERAGTIDGKTLLQIARVSITVAACKSEPRPAGGSICSLYYITVFRKWKSWIWNGKPNGPQPHSMIDIKMLLLRLTTNNTTVILLHQTRIAILPSWRRRTSSPSLSNSVKWSSFFQSRIRNYQTSTWT